MKTTGPVEAGADRIDAYRLIQRVGEGGMGVVYEAEQEQPIRRRVALKLIKLGMDTGQVIARFEAERQALALMDHPSIARVLDAGATREGRPYFAMEFVSGICITDYCDRNKLSNRERIELFLQVCSGVQHAHQKGIIHRDLKPSNVLVTLQDDRAVPKIIDFGVAKATARRLSERTMFTEMGQLVGTPEYMSPEQAEPTGIDIDTRTDVYSLGVLLYELLVGVLPFDASEFRQARFDQMLRKIREDEPLKPSSRLTTLGLLSTSAAANRGTTLPLLSKQLKGDLDWITLKSLSKDRARRYGSAAELAADLNRYLTHQPVLAGAPGGFYRMKKFVRRHQTGVGFAAIAVMLLSGFGVAMAIQARRVAREARTANRVLLHLEKLLRESNPTHESGQPAVVAGILADAQLRDRPEAQARLLEIMADRDESFGLLDNAIEARRRVLDLRLDLHAGADPRIATAKHRLAAVFARAGRFARAEPLALEALDERRNELGATGPEVADTLHLLAQVAWDHSDPDRAEALFGEALVQRRVSLPAGHPAIVRSLTGLGRFFHERGDYARSEELLDEASRAVELLEPDDPGLAADVAGARARLHNEQGRYREAEAPLRGALVELQAELGPNHPQVARAWRDLAVVLRDRYRELRWHADTAIGLGRRDMSIIRRSLGERSLEMGRSHFAYSAAWDREGSFQVENRRHATSAVDILREHLDPGHRELAAPLTLLGRRLVWDGRAGSAEHLLREALEIRRSALPAGHWRTARTARELGLALFLLGRPEEARPLLLEGLPGTPAEAGEPHASARRALEYLVLYHTATGGDEPAERYRERLHTLPDRRPLLAQDHRGPIGRPAELNYADDFVEKTMRISGRDLREARAATLWVYGQPYNTPGHPFEAREDYYIRVNGDSSQQLTFDPGLAYHYLDEKFAWASFEIPLDWLVPGDNTFFISEDSPEASWDHNNLRIGIAPDADLDRSWWNANFVVNCYDPALELARPEGCKGELMIVLELDGRTVSSDEDRGVASRAVDIRMRYRLLRFGSLLQAQGQHVEAERTYRAAARVFAVSGSSSAPYVALSEAGVGATFLAQGRIEEGRALLDRAYAAIEPFAPLTRGAMFTFKEIHRVYAGVDEDKAAEFLALMGLQ